MKEDVDEFNEFHFRSLFYSSFLVTLHLPIVYENVNMQNCFKFLALAEGQSFL